MDDFGETDAAAEFLAREKETLGEMMEGEIIIADNGKFSVISLLSTILILSCFVFIKTYKLEQQNNKCRVVSLKWLRKPRSFHQKIMRLKVRIIIIIAVWINLIKVVILDSFVGMHITSNIPATSNVREVPEKIQLWQENQKQMLEQKDRDEQEAIEKLRHDGKEELDIWYKNHQSGLEKTRAMRGNESAQLNTDTNGAVEGEEWKSIYQLCEFSQAKLNSKAGRDTSRMKNIFLQLKQNPLVRD